MELLGNLCCAGRVDGGGEGDPARSQGPQGCRVDLFPHGPVLGVERVGVSLEVDYIAQLGFLFDTHVGLFRGFVHRCQIIQWSHCLSVIWRGMDASLDQIRHVL